MLNIEEYSDGKKLFDGRYKLLRPLSTDGATADIWLAMDAKTIDTDLDSNEGGEKEESGLLVAIKIYRPANGLDVEGERRFREEFKIVYDIQHANILQPRAFSIFEETPYLVLPYCKYGSSEQLIGKKHTDGEIWKFILDVSSGLHRLHTNDPQIIHQDIKPANILIDNGKNFTITDFGISSQRNGVHGYYGEWNSGTLAYMAPERFQENAELIPESDIWAFGATLFEILTGNIPFGEEGGKAQAEEGLKAPEIKGVAADIQRLIHACLEKDVNKRPTAQTLIEAAKTKSYPVRKHKGLIIAIALLAVVAFVRFLFLPKPNVSPEPAPPTVEEVFANAVSYMKARSADSLNVGLNILDSLGGTGFTPALYEIAFTYGWYSDSVSVQRKKVLGIEMFEDKDNRYLPKEKPYSNKAVAALERINDINDPSYPNIIANSKYRLACYYIMPNSIYVSDYKLAKELLKSARGYALKANNDELLRKINESLDTFIEIE